MSGMDWKKVLRQRVTESEVVITARIESAIESGADWLVIQEFEHPELIGLCFEYVSKHIIRRARLIVKNKDWGETKESLDSLCFLTFLSDKLGERGVDVSQASIKIFEKMTGERHRSDDKSKT